MDLLGLSWDMGSSPHVSNHLSSWREWIPAPVLLDCSRAVLWLHYMKKADNVLFVCVWVWNVLSLFSVRALRLHIEKKLSHHLRVSLSCVRPTRLITQQHWWSYFFVTEKQLVCMQWSVCLSCLLLHLKNDWGSRIAKEHCILSTLNLK